MESISLQINGRTVAAAAGTTVLEAAKSAGIEIPNLCYEARCTPTGACRLCLVEIEGQRGYQTSCTRIAEEGMVVRTDTAELAKLRKNILELMLSEHRLECATCDKDGDCGLQDYAYLLGVKEDRFPDIDLKLRVRNYTSGDKAIQYDPSKCIRCGRCVKICAEVQMAEALTLRNRSGLTLVTTGFDVPLKESSCETCGQCVSTCPTSAMYERAAAGRGKIKDFYRVRTTCGYCGVGCQLDLNVNRRTREVVRVTSEPGVIPNDGNTCVKGRFGMEFIGRGDRLTTPLVRRNGKLTPATWDEALDLAAARFAEIKGESGPSALAGLSSARTTNEDNYIMQKFVRAVFGTNSVDHCARLCHASTVAGLARAFGSGAMTNSIEELSRAPAVFVIGSNTTECHPVIGILLRQAVAAGRTRLIVADPRKISLTRTGEIHLQQRPGSDVALINAMINVILEEGLEDREFIESRTEGFEEVRKAVAEMTPEKAEPITGVAAEDIRRAARIYAEAESASIVYSMGITQHTTGTDNVLSLANLAMITGNVGKECSGVNPLRGQNNVQGACDLGALPNVYNGYQRVDLPEIKEKFSRAWKAELSDVPGLTVVEIMEAAASGDVRGLYIMGENPMIRDPDIGHVKEALEKGEFLVVQDIFLSETAELADIVLPAASFAEKEGTFTNTERRVQRVRKAVEPPGESREDWRIICDIAGRMGYPMRYDSASDIMEEIAELTPIYGGISFDRIEEVGLQWPCPEKDHPGTPYLHRGRFSRGAGKFHPVGFLYQKERPDEEYPLILTTGRMLQHWHTGTMTRRCTVLDDLVPHGTLEINTADADKAGIRDGQTVKVRSRRGEITVPAGVSDKVKEGTVFMAFHFKEHPANALTIAALDPIAKIPEFKACAVRVEKVS